MKVYMQSLGCSKNQVDSEMILGVLKKMNIEPVEYPNDADIIMVNTCAFIESAREEAINTILDLATYKGENTKLVVCGCLSQRYKEELIKELPEVDRFVAISEYDQISTIITELLNIKPTSITPCFMDRVYASPDYMRYVRISDGCLNRCAFCAIPLIRGRLHSRSIEDIKEEVMMHVKNNVYEINIISQDTTRYGYDLYKKDSLIDLLKELVSIEGNFKIRLFYLYPEIVTHELIDFIKNNPKIMPYFDIPIQHSEDKMLKVMLRRGNREYLVDLFKYIRKEIPNAIIRTTVMVGFPYETNEDVLNMVEFIKEVKFDRLGCFTFSLEENTPATKYPQDITEEEKMRRYNMVMDAQYYISMSLNRDKIGNIEDVIIEEYDPDNYMYIGRSYAFAPDDIDGCIYVAAHNEYQPGDIVRVKILDADAYTLTGEEYEEN
ncbi:MAG: 30S ribosomal protein S12 methylthiotransferase RimO [Anaeroplasmataceae bacterium]